MEFAEDFNQLELLDTHGHLIPRGASSHWTGSHDDDDEQEEQGAEDEEQEHTEEWYLEKEEALKEKPEVLVLWAAEHNRVATLNSLLSAEPQLADCRDMDGYTPLHRAAYNGHIGATSALLSAGAAVNLRTADGWTPLHSACRWSRTAVASILLRHGAELNSRTNGGLTPLHLAASHTTSLKPDSAHTLELLLSQRRLRPGLHSNAGETACEVGRRSGPHFFLFEMVEDCISVVPTS